MEERIYNITRDGHRERERERFIRRNNFTKTLIVGYAPIR